MTKLKELRVKNNLYQREVADILEVSQAQYSRLELGLSLLNAKQIKTLAVLFKVSTDYLLEMQNEDQFKQIQKDIATKLIK